MSQRPSGGQRALGCGSDQRRDNRRKNGLAYILTRSDQTRDTCRSRRSAIETGSGAASEFGRGACGGDPPVAGSKSSLCSGAADRTARQS
jgi:hypothetical protein